MTNICSRLSSLVIGIVLALGILGCGYFISKGFIAARINQPYITVKGLAEQKVKADLALWRIPFTAVGNDLATVNAEFQRQQLVVLNFVKAQGFTDKDISIDQVKLTDRSTLDYTANKPEQRYLIKAIVRIRSNDVERVNQSSQATGDLIKEGVAISPENDDVNPTYYFTKLNSIRPDMLSNATRSAREVAARFAENTHIQLGSIRRASQGIFEIMSLEATAVSDNAWQLRREEQASIYKKIRLVSTIDYFLN